MGDYVEGPYPYAKFHHDTLPPFAPKYAKMCMKWLRYFWFFRQPTAKTPTPIFTINTSNDVVLYKDVPVGGTENKMLHLNPNFPPKKRKFVDNFRWDFENVASKRP